MKRWLFALILVAALAGLAAPGATAAEVVVIPVQGGISRAKFYFIRRALKQAGEEKAAAVVLDMDTYGGDLAATVKIQEALERSRLRTMTFINPNSGSAGALIAVSTREIYMAPVSAIGAAAPVAPGGQEIPKTIAEKTISYYSGYFRSVAQRNGHNPDIASAFIDKETRVVVNGQTINEKGTLLTLSAQEAARQINGKPVLAAGIADSIPDLLQKAGLAGAAVERVEPTGFETAAFWLTALGPLFLICGIVGAWIEFKTPGFGIPGAVSAVSFFLFFTGHFLAGLSGWEVAALFVLGVALLVVELAFLPGMILPGLAGVLMIFAALVLTMTDRYPGQAWSAEALMMPMLKLGAAVVAAGVIMAFLAKYLRKTPFYRRLVLHTPPSGHAAFSGEAKAMHERFPVGAEGVTLSILRPSGRAEFDGETLDVITRGEFVEPGTRVRIVSREMGNCIVVPVHS